MRLTEREFARISRRKRDTLIKASAPTEQQEQEAVIVWAQAARAQYPALQWLFHIPNGGHRDKATAVQMQLAGVQPGVPDLCLPYPMSGYHGLWIELKRADRSNGTTAHQDRWLSFLRSVGYRTAICYGADAAITELEEYLRGHR